MLCRALSNTQHLGPGEVPGQESCQPPGAGGRWLQGAGAGERLLQELRGRLGGEVLQSGDWDSAR